MLWAIFLHFYQPPNQKSEILTAVVSQSYRPILAILKKNPTGRLTINLDGCLVDQLLWFGFKDVIADLKELIQKGQVELVSSVKYHAFLPFIPEFEIIRRIKAGFLTNQKIFGENWNSGGFFPNELAVNPKIVKVAKKLGFSYLLADEISLNGKIEGVKSEKLYEDGGIKIFFANREISTQLRANAQLTFEDLTTLISRQNGESYLVSANDAEVFGHHYRGREEILAKIIKEQGSKWQLVTLGELLTKTEKVVKISVKKGSWETTSQDLQEGLPFSLWYNPKNLLQKLYWQLAWLVIDYFSHVPSKEKSDPGFAWHSARGHLDRGLASCYPFWASCRPWWNPDMVIAGAEELVRVARSLKELSVEEKRKAERLYVKIIETAWEWHWSGEAQRRIDEFEKEK